MRAIFYYYIFACL